MLAGVTSVQQVESSDAGVEIKPVNAFRWNTAYLPCLFIYLVAALFIQRLALIAAVFTILGNFLRLSIHITSRHIHNLILVNSIHILRGLLHSHTKAINFRETRGFVLEFILLHCLFYL